MLSVLTSLNHVVLYKTLPPCGKALSVATLWKLSQLGSGAVTATIREIFSFAG